MWQTIFYDPVEVNGFAFNDGIANDGAVFRIDTMDGWDNTADPNVVVNSYGYSDGVAAAVRFPLREKFVDIAGYVTVSSRYESEVAKSKLDSLFNPSTDLRVVRESPVPKAMNMRATSRVEYSDDLGEEGFRFSVQLMAPWPYRFNPVEQEITAGVFSGGSYYRAYDATAFTRTYDAQNNRTYLPSVDVGTTVGTETRRNLLNNPAFGVDLTGWLADLGNRAAPVRVQEGADWTMEVKPATNGDTRGARTTQLVSASVTDYVASIEVRVVSGTDSPTTMTVVANNPAPAAPATVSVGSTTREDLGGGWWRLSAVVTVTVAGDLTFTVLNTNATTANDTTYRVRKALLEKTSTVQPYFDGDSAPEADGAITYDWTADPHASPSIQITLTEVVESNPVQDTATVVNGGNADAYPVLIVQGPLEAGTWTLVNDTTAEEMSFFIDLSTGAQLTIDNLRKTAITNEQSVEYYLRGEWIRLVPGSNTLRLVSAEANPDARLIVRAADTWR